MTDYGRDLACATSLDPGMRDVIGATLMRQAIMRRLYTPRGGLLSAPFAVTVDLREYLSTDHEYDGRILYLMKAASIAAIQDDVRVLRVDVDVQPRALTRSANGTEYPASDRTVIVSVRGTGADGPFSLTLAVSSLTIELLRDQGGLP
jgi:hypothetical protein